MCWAGPIRPPPPSADYVTDLGAALRELGNGRGAVLLRDSYRQMVALPTAIAAYQELFRGLVDGDRPVLFHCTAGKDRTGWAAAVLLGRCWAYQMML